MTKSGRYICPICGYSGLKEPPRPAYGGGSYEFCPCCDFEFGVTDEDLGVSDGEWRNRWVNEGMHWRSRVEAPPEAWDPAQRMRNLEQAETGPAPARASKSSRVDGSSSGHSHD
jgi:hypothetical protein